MEMKNKIIFKVLCALVLAVNISFFFLPSSLVIFAAPASVSIQQNGSRLIADTGDFVGITYQWQSSENGYGFANIDGATEKYYDLTADDSKMYFKVVVDGVESEPSSQLGEVVVFDIGQGAITFNTSYSGKDSEGKPVSGPHDASNIYIVLQESEAMTGNNISFSGNYPDAPFNVTLDGINMGATPTNHNQAPGSGGSNTPTTGYINIPAQNSAEKHVTFYIKGENSVRNITYYNAGDTSEPQTVNSTLKFTDINGDGEVSGSLYIPKKLDADEIEAFVNTKTNYNHWNAGIGGIDSSSLVQNLHIAGGKIQVVTTLGDNCTAIGAGGNGYCQMIISGGEVIAHCNGTGAAIGGGIGWNAAGGRSDVLITGGKVYAKNHSMIESGTDLVGGVAIGAGSSFYKAGSEGKVTIEGGIVEAYGTFGNGIGGGNSSTSTGGEATIKITGGTVTATSIGGGNSKTGVGGDASVEIDNLANVTLIKGIGGGDSESGNGGAANINVKNGIINCAGVIGGGNGGGTGNGGDATINVSGGTLTAKSIGGGTGSIGGNGGAAEVEISGGTILTGSIGGGSTKNEAGKLGYAKAVISGGDIMGQFIMAEGTEPCTFTMTGGKLHGVNTADKTVYDYQKENGGAVYMEDPSGEVNISGGSIYECTAANGGAIYMTAGTFILSGEGSINNNKATENGGALYLGGGTVDINGGFISKNEATQNGGAAYLGGGTLTVTGGELRENKATENGGAAYLGAGTLTIDGGTVTENKAGIDGGGAFVNGGIVNVFSGSVTSNTATGNGGGICVSNGDFTMIGGNVDNNKSTGGSGGGIYVSAETTNVTVNVRSGSVSGNSAAINGGALAAEGKSDDKTIDVTIGVNGIHFDNNKEKVYCEHGIEEHTEIYDCPITKGNTAGDKGGAFYVTGIDNDKTKLSIFCVEEEGSTAAGENGQSDFMKVEGGTVLISTSSDMTSDENQNSYSGNIKINSSTYVTGGMFDIWGEMINPDIKHTITVDITKEGDHFVDHRDNDSEEENKYYKILYYENFLAPGATEPTGQYKEDAIKHGDSVTIRENIYVHPGYEIVGWNTNPDAQFDDTKEAEYNDDEVGGEKGWYRVGGEHEYKFNGFGRGHLTIYAIWKANGYTVKFDRNVPAGQISFGEDMNPQIFNYDQEYTLSPNQYSRPGYEFDGWSKTPDGSDGTKYTDQQKVINLTTEKGGVVTLYAQWKECDHNESTHTYTYTLSDDGKTIIRECSCKGYSDTATVFAEDSVYSKDSTNTAKVIYSGKDWSLNISYEKLNEETGKFEAINVEPKNAGTYKASITKNDVTASITYVIEKAEQPAPEKTEFDIVDNDDNDGMDEKNTILVKIIEDSPLAAEDTAGYNCEKEYMLVYYDSNGAEYVTEWKKAEDELNKLGYAIAFDFPFAMTTYTVYSRYSEGDNYKASPETAANSKYHYAGNVGLEIIDGEGVVCIPVPSTGADDVISGIVLNLSLKEGYYFPTEYELTMVTEDANDEEITGDSAPKMETTDKYKKYSINEIPQNCTIYVTVQGAIKIPEVTVNVTEKQVFEAFEQNEATISHDSAYTAGFDVLYFNTSDYSDVVLGFDNDLPVGTKIIVLDRNTEHFSYYWTKVETASNEFSIKSFTKMGTAADKFAVYDGDMLLNVIVDFSEVAPESRLPYLKDDAENKLNSFVTVIVGSDETDETVELETAGEEQPETEEKIDLQTEGEPAEQSEVTEIAENDVYFQVGPVEVRSEHAVTNLKAAAQFVLEGTENGLGQKITYTYTKSLGEASIWDERDTALVFELISSGELPEDAHMVFIQGEYRIEAYPNDEGEFVFTAAGPETGSVDAYLVSAFFKGDETYSFKVSWMCSESIAEVSPMNGDTLAMIDGLELAGRYSTTPSIKVYEGKNTKLFEKGTSTAFEAQIKWQDFTNTNVIEIALLLKNEAGEFVNTGWIPSQFTGSNLAESGDIVVSIPLGSFSAGSYCVRVTVMDNVEAISEANYYFIID